MPDATQPLSKVKLFVPRVRQRSVVRPRLLSLIDQGVANKLTLVSAPAGSGKTTLLSEWHATETGRRTPLAWVSLEEADNHPARFWLYVLEALEQWQPGRAGDLPLLIGSAQPMPFDTAVRLLVNRLADLPEDSVLVLDDYHTITSEEIHRSVALLLELMPPQFHLVIITRVDPPLPLTRLRVRGELTEVRLADLRFTTSEAATFLEEATGLQLSERQVAVLEEKTEGWIAGLQLAALSMRNLTDVDGFVEAFAGSHRYIVDYLIEEILRHQTEEVQAFLMETSILDRLSGPLCDAVSNRSDSQAVLEDLERRNLFLIALDHHRQWYRYHHLFSEVLRSRLERERPGEAPRLHRQASEWYEGAGLVEPAVNHALGADDFERAIKLVTAAAEQIWHKGQNEILLRWLEALPADLVQASPAFQFSMAWACMTSGRLEMAESLLHRAEELLSPDRLDQADLMGRVLASQAHCARLRLNLQRARALSGRALALLTAENGAWRGMAFWNLGAIDQWTGDPAAAAANYAEAQRLFRSAGDWYGLLRSTAWSGQVLADTGRLPEAIAACSEALALVTARTGDSLPMLSIAHVEMGELLYERHELAEAEGHLKRAVMLSRQGGLLDVTWLAYIPLALLKQAQGESLAALDYLKAADDLAPRVPWALAHSLMTRVRILLCSGEREAAALLAPQLEALARDERAPMQGAVLALGALKVEQGYPEESLALLDTLRQRSPNFLSIRHLALRAVALKASGNQSGALATLEQALQLAAASGNVAPFLELGSPLTDLLRHGLPLWKGDLLAHARRLLELSAGRPASATLKTSSAARLIELPSEREREVLALLADGASNEEIAGRLFISLHTAKKHVANIIAKLGASNRTQAVARGRELGLL